MLSNFSTLLNSSDYLTPSSSRSTLILSLRICLIVFGSVGNYCLLTGAWNDRASQNGTRLLILNIATSSFLLLAIGQVGALIHLHAGLPNACPFFIFNTLIFTVVNWADVALAINRMFAVCYPHQYGRIASTRNSIYLYGATWVISVGIVALTGSGLGSSFQETRLGVCAPVVTSTFGVLLIMMMSLIPIFICGLLSFCIVVAFYKDRGGSIRSASVDSGERPTRNNRRHLARAMIISFSWCFVSTLPWVVVLNFFPNIVKSYPVWGDILRLLSAAEYSVNPVSAVNY